MTVIPAAHGLGTGALIVAAFNAEGGTFLLAFYAFSAAVMVVDGIRALTAGRT